MSKLPLRSRRLMRKHRRLIAYAGYYDAHCWPIPVFRDHLLNRAIWREGERILHSRTFRKKLPPDE